MNFYDQQPTGLLGLLANLFRNRQPNPMFNVGYGDVTGGGVPRGLPPSSVPDGPMNDASPFFDGPHNDNNMPVFPQQPVRRPAAPSYDTDAMDRLTAVLSGQNGLREGPNQNIGDDTRARALAWIARQNMGG